VTPATTAGDTGTSSCRTDTVLRPVRWWDVERLLPVERELFGGTAWTPEAFWSELARPQSRHYLLAESPDGDLLGYAGLMVTGGQADVQTVAVAPAARGQGLGSRLVSALLAEAVRRGARSVLLEVRADNQAALRLYERHGFERISVRRRYYQPGDVDAVIMRRRPPPTGSTGAPGSS
jgi:[ribosomal protein S18]-alanine N-acetyltransferase